MKNENSTCPICGNPTSIWYGNARKDKLCREHAQQMKEGIIEQCPNCGKWHTTGKPCECKSKAIRYSENVNNSELTCSLPTANIFVVPVMPNTRIAPSIYELHIVQKQKFLTNMVI